jgi:hypothetical protein
MASPGDGARSIGRAQLKVKESHLWIALFVLYAIKAAVLVFGFYTLAHRGAY